MMYYSPSWQVLEERVDEDATFTDDPGSADIDLTRQYFWGLRYIDDILAHRTDNGSDGSYELTWYHLTDEQFSTVAIIDDSAVLHERVAYDPYGHARHQWLEDVDGDGDHDTTDNDIIDLIRTLGSGTVDISSALYNVDADLDLDGDIDGTDDSLSSGASAALPQGQISSDEVGNSIGWDGYFLDAERDEYLVRHRSYRPLLGRWLGRDPATYVDAMGLYEYAVSSPQGYIDPRGTDLTGLTGDACGVLIKCLVGPWLPKGMQRYWDTPAERDQRNLDGLVNDMRSICDGAPDCSGCSKATCYQEAEKIARAYLRRVQKIRRQDGYYSCSAASGLLFADIQRLGNVRDDRGFETAAPLNCWRSAEVGHKEDGEWGNHAFIIVGHRCSVCADGKTSRPDLILDPWPGSCAGDNSHKASIKWSMDPFRYGWYKVRNEGPNGNTGFGDYDGSSKNCCKKKPGSPGGAGADAPSPGQVPQP